MPQVKAKKSYGQHFLTDEEIARRIADTLTDNSTDSPLATLPVVEIGPGTGALTRWLIKPDRQLTAIEVDPEAAEYMHKAYPELDLRLADFLHLDINTLFPGRKIAVIGNYPYNISSQIFFRVLENRDKVALCSGMLQREVAQRICANAGSKTYGILSVLLQLWYECEYLFTVDETAFRPAPKVKSGVLRLVRNNRTDIPCSEQLLKSVVKTTFGHRRKTLRNSLAPIAASLAATTLPQGLDTPQLKPYLTLRPEQLPPEEFITLTSILQGIKTE